MPAAATAALHQQPEMVLIMSMNELIQRSWSRPFSRRITLLAVVLGTLLVMAFYTITDTTRLEHNHVLDGADYLGYAVCHRLTDRSFSIAGRQLPLCARCTGMYLGVSLTFIVLGLAGRRRWADFPPARIMVVQISFIGLMAVDGINSYSHFFPDFPHLYEPQNWLRLATGTGTGLTMGAFLFPALAQTLWIDQQRRPAIGSWRELAGLLILAGITILLVLSNQPALLYVLSLVSAAGVLLVLAAVNSVMLLITLKKEAQASRWSQVLPALAIGLVVAVIQVAIIGFLRYSLTGTMTGMPGL
jgi:uncharacterized membrane protein